MGRRRFLSGLENCSGKTKKKNGTQHASARTPGRRRHSARGVRTTPPGSRRRRRRHGRDQRRARAPGGLHQGVHPPAAQVHQARPQGCARAGRAGRARAQGVEGLFARAATRAPRAARSAEWTRGAGSRLALPSRGHAGMTTAAACTARAWVGGERRAQRGGPCMPRRTADRRRCCVVPWPCCDTRDVPPCAGARGDAREPLS